MKKTLSDIKKQIRSDVKRIFILLLVLIAGIIGQPYLRPLWHEFVRAHLGYLLL